MSQIVSNGIDGSAGEVRLGTMVGAVVRSGTDCRCCSWLDMRVADVKNHHNICN